MRIERPLRLLFLSLILVAPSGAIEIDGDTAIHEVEIGGIDVEVVVDFEDVTNLTRKNLGLSVELLSPLDILLDIVPRLPDDLLVSVPAEFPIVVTIEPPPAGDLTFHGVATVEIHTHALSFSLGTPLRLLSASDGGDFRDITAFMGAGSYRARGTKGGFSEFLIALDLRPAPQVTAQKLDDLEAQLDAYAGRIPPGLFGQLEAIVDQVRADYDGGDLAGAIDGVEELDRVLRARGGGDIEDAWSASQALVNVEGDLRSLADTLRLSLIVESDGLLP